MSARAIALDLAAAGLPVFPCRSDKRPACTHGFKDASTDPRRIHQLFAGSAAQLVGVPTGAASGLSVLDIDLRNGGGRWEAEHLDRLGETRIHGTMSGGRHYLFRHLGGIRNSSGKLAPGIDTRGEGGGYAIWPPSTGYQVIHDVAPARWPVWLWWSLLEATEPPPRPVPSAYTAPAEIADRRIQAFIHAVLDAVAAAQDGFKHVTLRNAALQIGGVAARAGLSDAEAIELLIAALPSAKSWDNARRTAAWGLAAGRRRPITLPDREWSGRSAA